MPLNIGYLFSLCSQSLKRLLLKQFFLSQQITSSVSYNGKQHSPAPDRGKLISLSRHNFTYRSGRVGISSPLEGQRGGIAITSQAFQDPLTYKNPYLPAFGTSDVPHFGTFASPYYEAEIQDYTAHREPRYLDLFEPGVQVIRDPKLDQPCPTWKERLRLLFSSNLGAFATSKFVIGCCVLLVVLIIGIVAIVSISKLLRSVSFDPRVTFPYVTTATSCGLVKGCN
ncbi:hypothetical protein Avbf_08740 [Armadillidium vulgare]|nr:hypothetical protein Avbf_08740 [Armadillidium vulgare]